MEESHIKRALIAAASETVPLATADKLGKVSPYRIAPVGAATTLLVSEAASEQEVDALRGAVQLLRVAR